MSLDASEEDIIKTVTKDEQLHDIISYSDDENNLDSLNNKPETKISDKTYKENLMFLLNKEFVQVLLISFLKSIIRIKLFIFVCCNFKKMRTIQVIEDEKTNEKQSDPIFKDFQNSFIYDSRIYEDFSQGTLQFIIKFRIINISLAN